MQVLLFSAEEILETAESPRMSFLGNGGCELLPICFTCIIVTVLAIVIAG